jgi:hypothetical protein
VLVIGHKSETCVAQRQIGKRVGRP